MTARRNKNGPRNLVQIRSYDRKKSKLTMVHEYFLYIYHEGHIICIDIINLNFFSIYFHQSLSFACFCYLIFFIFNCTQRKEDASLKIAINRIFDRRIPVSLLTGIPPPPPPARHKTTVFSRDVDWLALPVCCLNLASVCLCQHPIFHYFHSFDVFYLFCFVQKAKGILGQIYFIVVKLFVV